MPKDLGRLEFGMQRFGHPGIRNGSDSGYLRLQGTPDSQGPVSGQLFPSTLAREAGGFSRAGAGARRASEAHACPSPRHRARDSAALSTHPAPLEVTAGAAEWEREVTELPGCLCVRGWGFQSSLECVGSERRGAE